MTVFAAQSCSNHSASTRSVRRRTQRNARRCTCPFDAPKWTAIVSTINMWHGVLALIFIGQYSEIIAFVCANFACVILALGGVFCKKPAMLAPNVTVKIACIVCLPVAVIYLKLKASKTSLNPEDIPILVWLLIVEISLIVEVVLTCNAFKKIDATDTPSARSNVTDYKVDPPPAYAIAIIDTELPSYDEAVKLARAHVHSPPVSPLPTNETVLVVDAL